MMLKKLFCLWGCILILSGCVVGQRVAIKSADKKIKAGKYDEALTELEKAENYTEPKPVEKGAIYCLRGMCYEGMGKNEDALKAYNYVVDNTPDTEFWYYAKGRLNLLEASTIPSDSILKYIDITKKTLPVDKTSEYYWFPGMLNPPALSVALPESFDVFPGTPLIKGQEDYIAFDMYSGVFWTDKSTGFEYAFQRNTNLANAQKPLFFSRLCSDVAQIPGTGDFTIEKSLNELNKRIGATDVVVEKKKIGSYPVLIWTGKRNDKTEFYCLWLGCNSPDGWAFLIDYRIPPKATVEEKKAYLEIWNNFISMTKQKDSAFDNKIFAKNIADLRQGLISDLKAISLAKDDWKKLKQSMNPHIAMMFNQPTYSDEAKASFDDAKKELLIEIKSKDGKNLSNAIFSYSGELKSSSHNLIDKDKSTVSEDIKKESPRPPSAP